MPLIETDDSWIEVPYQSLEKETLEQVLKDIVTRDGTDYGLNEVATQKKVSQAKCSLTNGNATLFFDTDTQTCHLMSREC